MYCYFKIVYAVHTICTTNLAILENTVNNETATTKRSNKLKNDRQNAPSCKTKPYEIILKIISKVKTAVKKWSNFFNT